METTELGIGERGFPTAGPHRRHGRPKLGLITHCFLPCISPPPAYMRHGDTPLWLTAASCRSTSLILYLCLCQPRGFSRKLSVVTTFCSVFNFPPLSSVMIKGNASFCLLSWRMAEAQYTSVLCRGLLQAPTFASISIRRAHWKLVLWSQCSKLGHLVRFQRYIFLVGRYLIHFTSNIHRRWTNWGHLWQKRHLVRRCRYFRHWRGRANFYNRIQHHGRRSRDQRAWRWTFVVRSFDPGTIVA